MLVLKTFGGNYRELLKLIVLMAQGQEVEFHEIEIGDRMIF